MGQGKAGPDPTYATVKSWINPHRGMIINPSKRGEDTFFSRFPLFMGRITITQTSSFFEHGTHDI
jgi:hypothetical protein